jgi:hypothetical protein
MANQLPQLIAKIARFAGSADRAAASALDRAAAAATQKVVQDLRARGPWWTGTTAKAWTVTTGGGSAGGLLYAPADHRRTERQVLPLVAIPQITGRQRFDAPRYTITNRAYHAAIALDLVPGRKDVTAERDWFQKYLDGGELNRAIGLAAEPVLRDAWRG